MKDWFIEESATIKEAMEKMKDIGEKNLFVVTSDRVLKGSLSDGDIRKWIVSDGKLTDAIDEAYNDDPIFFQQQYDVEKIKKIFIAERIEAVPIVDELGKVIEILTWDQVFSSKKDVRKKHVDIDAVIMAGGKGTRLDPVTRILPKPLMPIGDKAIIECIIENLEAYGIQNFHISINHKARLIKAFFEEQNRINISFLEEDMPLGTAGALALLTKSGKERFLVTNCDILLDVDLEELVQYHVNKGFDLTLVVCHHHHVMPYGVCKIEKGGGLLEMEEKPSYDLWVNTGMYLINKKIFGIIPPNARYDMDSLIYDAKKRGFSIGVFPINAKLWADIGHWEGYQRTVNVMNSDFIK